MVARNNSVRGASRGPAANRRDRTRKDRDGDLAMDVAVKGRARVGKSSPAPSSSVRDSASRGRGGILSATAQRAILRQAGARDVSMKELRGAISHSRGNVELRVTGWTKSKASSNPDGGVSSLVLWLEKKASSRLGSRIRSVKIKKSHQEGGALIISAPEADMGALLRLNGWQWAGINVTIERVGGAVQDPKHSNQPSSQTQELKTKLRQVLESRYDQETKYLDLSALGQDPTLMAQQIFNSKSTATKFFPALMAVLDGAFDAPHEKHEAVLSVSLANNDLEDVTAVTTLSQFLPKIHNLDLSNNKIARLTSLEPWRKKFYHLQHLVIVGNPIEQNEAECHQTLVQWYPNLRKLNSLQVRTEEEVAKKAKITEMPFPVRSPLFQDEGGICENFVRSFFAGFDSDRAALVNYYYDGRSDFSISVNTGAPRDPAGQQQGEKQEWDSYIKQSRNLKKISHLPARQARLARGAQAVQNAFAALPRTKHPDLTSEARKWMIEAHIQPGVPDTTGQSASGVDGFMVVVHGEYDELDAATGQAGKKRSFDRTFVLGPSGTATVVRVVSDTFTVRSYGGTQAFEPDNSTDVVQSQHAAVDPTVPQLPAGLSVEMAEQMVVQLQQQTSMTAEYAKMCLEQMGWNYEAGLKAFHDNRANLPPEAFVQA